MRLLALDSATEQLALALVCGEQRLLSNGPGGALSSQRMIPLALSLLSQAGLPVGELDAIAFSCGPGAFTGLRTAVSVAQGLAFGIDKPVLAIDSLMLVAEDWRAQREAAAQPTVGESVWVVMDARMNEIYAAAYCHDGAVWQVLQAPALHDLDSLHGRWLEQPPRHLCGSALAAFAGQLQTGAAELVPAQADRAAALLQLACMAWQAGQAVPAEQALPLYLRDKVALTTAERELLRAAAANGATAA